jgi:hypothetical protein
MLEHDHQRSFPPVPGSPLPCSSRAAHLTLRAMRNRFDQLAKQIGQEALGPSGPTVAHDEISPETQHADLRHEPDPSRAAERVRLGFLGRIAAVLCLIEVYGHAPSADELRACLAKHIAFWQQRTRKAKRAQPTEPFVEPFLWIIAAGAPTAMLRRLELKPAPDWPAGVYFFSSARTSFGWGSSWRASCPASARPSSSGSWRRGRC